MSLSHVMRPSCFGRTAEDQARQGGMRRQGLDQCRPVLRLPMFLGPGGEGTQHDIALGHAQRLEPNRRLAALGLIQHHAVELPRLGYAQGCKQVLVLTGQAGLGIHARQNMVHQERRAFPGAQADAYIAPGTPGQETTLEQPLQIQYHIETALTQHLHKGEHDSR